MSKAAAGGEAASEVATVSTGSKEATEIEIECVAVMPLGEDQDVWAVGGVSRGGLGEGEDMRVWSGGRDGLLRCWRVPASLCR